MTQSLRFDTIVLFHSLTGDKIVGMSSLILDLLHFIFGLNEPQHYRNIF